MLRRLVLMSSKNLSTTAPRLSAAKIAELENQLAENPYFVKFKDRIEALKQSDPDTYVQRLQLMLDQTEKQKKKDAGKLIYFSNLRTNLERNKKTHVKGVAQPYLFLWELFWELQKWDNFETLPDYRVDLVDDFAFLRF